MVAVDLLQQCVKLDLQVTLRPSAVFGAPCSSSDSRAAKARNSSAIRSSCSRSCIVPQRCGWTPEPIVSPAQEIAASRTTCGLLVRKIRLPEVQTCAKRRRGSRRLTVGNTSPSISDVRPASPGSDSPFARTKSRMRPMRASVQSRRCPETASGCRVGARVFRNAKRSPRRQCCGG